MAKNEPIKKGNPNTGGQAASGGRTVTILDPVTRIEGHMKVEVSIETLNGVLQVVDAKCTGTQFRGFEQILQGRDPKDAPYLTERICGVCPVSHGLAATMALEKAAGLNVPANARILRNLVLGANYLQSHILHFYLLASLDYVTPPASAPWTPSWQADLRPGLEQIAGRLGEAVTMRRKAHEMGALFGGKLPHPSAYQAGGMTTKPTTAAIGAFSAYLGELQRFIETAYLPDVEALDRVYGDYGQIGKGPGNLMAFGVFDLDDTSSPQRLFCRGLVQASAPTSVQTLATSNIRELVTYSWYADSTNNLPPAGGSTVPVDPASKTQAYSWLKAPRYAGVPFEMGPLARMWVNGDYRRGVSVMDRHLARALEAQKVVRAMHDWLQQLAVGGAVISPYTTPYGKSGEGLTEAPRGGLGHWLTTSSTGTRAPAGGPAIAHYQVITPTCWNASPMDGNGAKGPLEQALIGTPVKDVAQPIEVLRVIHSFDPCLSCAVHVMRPGRPPTVVRAAGGRV